MSNKMKIPALFKEYIWLVNTIYHAKRISLAEINAKWADTDMSGGVEMARTTFNRHKSAIEDIFGIFIECDRRNGYEYYIGNPRVLKDDTVQNWMLSTLSLGNVISESMSLQDRIVAERIAVNNTMLTLIINAMKSGHRLNIRYRQYGSPQSYWTGTSPYCLKLFRQKWYLLGKLFANKFMVFSLNKIEEVKVQESTFKTDKDFNPAEFFAPYFGVMIDEDLPTTNITIRAYGDERYEISDVPIHKSQMLKAVNPAEDYADFELTLKPTPDFIDYLLSKIGRLKVLGPQEVIDKINQRIDKR